MKNREQVENFIYISHQLIFEDYNKSNLVTNKQNLIKKEQKI